MRDNNDSRTLVYIEMAPHRWVLLHVSYTERRRIFEAVTPERRFATADTHVLYITYGEPNEGPQV